MNVITKVHMIGAIKFVLGGEGGLLLTRKSADDAIVVMMASTRIYGVEGCA
jgi:hypothetical protein